MFRCDNCKRSFSDAKVVEETHGLDCPPYEKIAVCPYCESTEIAEFNPTVEKIDVAQKLLEVIAGLNRYTLAVQDIYGTKAKNEDLDDAFDSAIEYICELYDFMPASVVNLIMHAHTEGDIKKIVRFLEG